MALAHRASSVWVFTVLFLIFTVIRLDEKITWYWGIVFIPIWILDAATIVFLVAMLILKRNLIGFHTGKHFKIWLLAVYVLKVAFLIVLCAKLDGLLNAPYYYVFIPLWLMLGVMSVTLWLCTAYSAMFTYSN